jgi:hypothetical protein
MKKTIRISTKEFDDIIRSSSSPIEAIREIKKRAVDISNFAQWEGTWDFYCSVCHEPFEYRTPHCPHCGVKMKNGSEDLI